VQQQDPADEVEAQEHRQRQKLVDGHRWHSIIVGVDGRQDEAGAAGGQWKGMHCADGQFGGYLDDRSKSDGNTPIIDTIVDDKQLLNKSSTHREISVVLIFIR